MYYSEEEMSWESGPKNNLKHRSHRALFICSSQSALKKDDNIVIAKRLG